jgi:hypothetical protein
MKSNSTICVCLVVGLITLLLPACFEASDKEKGTADSAMLLDESATPAPHALIRLQERPVFQVDERKRPFAAIEDLADRSDKIRVGDKPMTIRESKPE